MNVATKTAPYFSTPGVLQKMSPNAFYLLDTGFVWQNSDNQVVTGGYRPIEPNDLGGASAFSGITSPINRLSSANGTTSSLLTNEAWTGTAENVSQYSSVVTALKTDADGTLYMEFSPDGTNWDSSLSFAINSGINEVHRLTITRPYYRSRYVNSSQSQSYLRLTTLFGEFEPLTSNLNSNVQEDADSLTSRSVLMGRNGNGKFKNVPVTPEGHLEVEVHGPRNPFGSIHVENLTPIIQGDAVYGVNEQVMTPNSGLGGSVGESESQFVLQTNTQVGGNATLQSRKRLRYRPGQGVVARFTARFTSGINNSFQVAGIGHPEDGLYFGYSGARFGILHSQHGIREVQTLTLTSPAASAGNVQVVLNGAAHNVQVTNSNNGYRTAYEISTGVYSGWYAQAVGSGILFLANSVGNKTSLFALSGLATSAVGTFAKTRSGQALTENWIFQDQWNKDIMNGTGASAITLDPTKGNVYQLGVQYLGYGALTCQIESAADDNNPTWETVHTINYPNKNTRPNFGNPSFPLTFSAYSFGSTGNLTLNTASFAGFIEGQKIYNGPTFTYEEDSTAVSTTYKAMFTVKNGLTFKGKSNQCVINLLSLSVACEHTQPVTFFIIKNANLAGNPNFRQYSKDSCSLYDNSATTLTVTDNSQILLSTSLGKVGEEIIDLSTLGFDLQPGESVTVAGRTAAGTVQFSHASLNTREDQ